MSEKHVGRPAGHREPRLVGGDPFLLEPSPAPGVELAIPPVDGVCPTKGKEADALPGPAMAPRSAEDAVRDLYKAVRAGRELAQGLVVLVVPVHEDDPEIVVVELRTEPGQVVPALAGQGPVPEIPELDDSTHVVLARRREQDVLPMQVVAVGVARDQETGRIAWEGRGHEFMLGDAVGRETTRGSGQTGHPVGFSEMGRLWWHRTISNGMAGATVEGDMIGEPVTIAVTLIEAPGRGRVADAVEVGAVAQRATQAEAISNLRELSRTYPEMLEGAPTMASG